MRRGLDRTNTRSAGRTVVFARPIQKRGHVAIVALAAAETAHPVRTPSYEDAADRVVAGR
jgi:hypothetical protein